MSKPVVYTYVCTSPDCPPEFRAVAHCFAPVFVPKKRERVLSMLPATQTGESPDVCGLRLIAFLQSEIEREGAMKRNATAAGDRLRAARLAKKEAPQ